MGVTFGSLLFKRFAGLIAVMLTTTVLVFLLSTVVQSDPARAALGPFASQESVAQYRIEHGLDQPIWTQYSVYMQNLLRGDLGESVLYQRPVMQELRQAIPATLELVIPSLIFAGIMGLLLGAVGAIYSNRWPDYISRFLAIFGMSMPVFWLGIILQIIFFGYLGWLPVTGRIPATELDVPITTGFITIDAVLAGRLDLLVVALKHLVLPVFTLSLINLATLARISRSTLLDVLHQPYIRVAHSKGLKTFLVVFRHAFPNALIPLVTLFGLMIGEALQGSVIVETIFSWPGLGRRVVGALLRADVPMISAYALLLAFAYGAMNFLVDLSYFILDPRIRERR